jgi:hypothetical protein
MSNIKNNKKLNSALLSLAVIAGMAGGFCSDANALVTTPPMRVHQTTVNKHTLPATIPVSGGDSGSFVCGAVGQSVDFELDTQGNCVFQSHLSSIDIIWVQLN